MSHIHKAIVACMRDVPHIGKDRRNSQQGYNFRGIDDMYNALHPVLAKHGVYATSEVLRSQREERQTQKGGVITYTILEVKFTFYSDVDGSCVSSTMVGEAMDSADKSSNKAMSAAMKYALMQLFCIPTADVKDTEYDTHDVAPRQPAPAFTPAPTTAQDAHEVELLSLTASGFAQAVREYMTAALSGQCFSADEVTTAVTRAESLPAASRHGFWGKLETIRDQRADALEYAAHTAKTEVRA
jgi:hypothetical protein